MSLDAITLIVRIFLITGAIVGYSLAGYAIVKLIKFLRG